MSEEIDFKNIPERCLMCGKEKTEGDWVFFSSSGNHRRCGECHEAENRRLIAAGELFVDRMMNNYDPAGECFGHD